MTGIAPVDAALLVAGYCAGGLILIAVYAFAVVLARAARVGDALLDAGRDDHYDRVDAFAWPDGPSEPARLPRIDRRAA